MADPMVSDVFRFVAVRPPQLTSNPPPIDDERPLEDGMSPAGRLSEELDGSRSAAQEYLNTIDFSWFEPYLDAHLRLVEAYRGRPEPSADEVGDVLGGVGADRAPRRAEVERAAWNAYYCCCALGPSMAQQAELPLSAIRVLRFIEARRAGKLTDPLTLLTAGAAIPPTFLPFPDEAGRVEESEPPGPSRKAARRTLREISALSSLRSRLVSAAQLATPAVERSDVGDNVTVRLATGAARLFTDLPNDLTSAEHEVAARLDLSPLSVDGAISVLDGRLAGLVKDTSMWTRTSVIDGILEGVKAGKDKEIQIASIPPGLLGIADPGTSKDEEVAGRIRVLGMGDLKVVKQTLLRYEPGEVAHIENVMGKETRSRTHRVLDRREETLVTSEELSETTERDTQSTDRFEMQRETERTIQEDMSVQAGMTVSASYGPVSMTAHGDFAYSTSKLDSEKASSNTAKEIVDKSRSRIEKKTRTERTTRTLHEAEETNVHAFVNDEAKHVVGVYRWVDKRYRAQIYNYGVRLMLEFVVPEPAAFYKAARVGRARVPAGLKPPPPLVNDEKKPLDIADITTDSYRKYVARYSVSGVNPPPAATIHAGVALAKDEIALGHTYSEKPKEFVVPAGYTLSGWVANASIIVRNHPKFFLQIADEKFVLINQPHPDAPDGVDFEESDGDTALVDVTEGPVPVSIVTYDVLAYAVNISAKCTRTSAAYWHWRTDTFQKIAAAYQQQRAEYDATVSLIQSREPNAIVGANPLANEAAQATELKKLCLTLLTGQHFKRFDAMTEPIDPPEHIPEIEIGKALSIGPVIQFFEQAFEWEQMTYLYYPYFWGAKSRWVAAATLTDPDPMMEAFLQAGAARVVVPVSVNYTAAMSYFLACEPMPLEKKIWNGSTAPDIKDPLYKSIAEEVRAKTDDLQGATAEGSPWEYTLPTTLVWLQGDGALPEF